MAACFVEIFVPFVSCPCSSGKMDRKMLRFNQVLVDLKGRFGNDFVYVVWSLNLHLHEFRKRPELVEILQTEGAKKLPCIYVNGELRFKGAYPKESEMQGMISQSLDN